MMTDEALHRCFQGWDKVESHYDVFRQRLHVKLQLDTAWLENGPPDLDDLKERLFRRSNAWHLVRLLEKGRKRAGLWRYGRKR